MDLSTAEVFYSSDLGKSWSFASSTTYVKFFYGVSIGSNGNAYIIGEKYKIFQASYGDGYTSLTTVFDPTTTTLSISSNNLKRYRFLAICTIDGVSVIAVGNIGFIYYSTDSGSNWYKSSSIGASAVDINAVSCYSSNVAFASGASNYVAKSTDGGSTWTALSVFSDGVYSSYGISAVDLSSIYVSGFILGDSTYQGSIYKTSNGGTSWTLESSTLYNIYSLAMVDDVTGVAGVVANSPSSVFTRVYGAVTILFSRL